MCPGVNTFLAREIWTAVNGIMRSRGAAVAPLESFGVSGSAGMRVGRCQRDWTARGPSVEHQPRHGHEEGMDFIFWMWHSGLWAGWGLDSSWRSSPASVVLGFWDLHNLQLRVGLFQVMLKRGGNILKSPQGRFRWI